ncbi:MAG TPA: hypothetical protein VL333_12355 [Candidatus Saccharimonadales bacterium]|nr:hypothetical protein [Candidatus Saccharimonadales bacterium]
MSRGVGVTVGAALVGAALVGAAVVGAAVVGAAVVGAAVGTVVAGATVNELDGNAEGDAGAPALWASGRVSRMRRPKAISAISAAPRNAASRTLDPVALGLPGKA